MRYWALSVFIALIAHEASAAESKYAIPAWLNQAIADRRASKSPDVIEEATYQGKRMFVLHHGVPDSGHEHMLLNADGKEICQFGGFVGRVTSGACDIGKIIYVRTLYPSGPSRSK
ncbi:MAG TPA: hypothetical protein VNW15_15325 [Rhizomicrobium sp.]|jgi:hypothetical protein|nr:hypothetical protein [Rhizomicrobium sp.]